MMPPDDLAAELLIPGPPEAQIPQPQPMRPPSQRMRPLSMPFVRVPVSWFTTDPRPYPFTGHRGRLLLLLLHLSRWGQRPVVLTSAVVEQIGLSRKERWRHLERLEADRWISIKRAGNKAAVVRPIIIAG